MTDNAGPQPGATPDTLPPARTIVQMLARALASSAILVTVYYLLPFNHSSRWLAITMLVIGLVLLTGLVAVQVRWVAASRYPRPWLRDDGKAASAGFPPHGLEAVEPRCERLCQVAIDR